MTSRVNRTGVHYGRPNRFGHVKGMDLMRCHTCNSTNATALDEPRPETCSSCGASLVSGITVPATAFVRRRGDDDTLDKGHTVGLDRAIIRFRPTDGRP